MQPLLEIQNLSVTFRQDEQLTEAVKNISFNIYPGEMLAIAGESGSGKSITALSLLGLLPSDAMQQGSIILNTDKEERLLNSGNNKNWRKIRGNRISMIFQEPMTSLNPIMRCGKQITEALRSHKKISQQEARRLATELLGLTGFAIPRNIFKRYPHQLSGGQKQRIMIAMAMICDPLLLIADEPTTALDVRIQKEILDMIRELKEKQKMSVLLITHDMGIIADYSDRLLVMHKGKIVEEGLTGDVLKNPRHPLTQALITCRPSLHPKGVKLPVWTDISDEVNEKVETIAPVSDSIKASPDDILIKVENLKVNFPAIGGFPFKYVRALDNISFNIYRNEILGVAGESGSGKTTLGRAILQLIKPSSGRILLEGKDITGINRKANSKALQIVFQDPFGSLNPSLTAGETILEVMKTHGIGKNKRERSARMAELLEKVRLDPDHAKRFPHQFSGGQRQRICIARALACNPSFVVFDESVSALDISMQARIINLITELKETFGFTALFISHDLSVVHHISDRIMVMRGGKIIETGSAETIFSNPSDNYTKSLLDAIPGKKLTALNN